MVMWETTYHSICQCGALITNKLKFLCSLFSSRLFIEKFAHYTLKNSDRETSWSRITPPSSQYSVHIILCSYSIIKKNWYIKILNYYYAKFSYFKFISSSHILSFSLSLSLSRILFFYHRNMFMVGKIHPENLTIYVNLHPTTPF